MGGDNITISKEWNRDSESLSSRMLSRTFFVSVAHLPFSIHGLDLRKTENEDSSFLDSATPCTGDKCTADKASDMVLEMEQDSGTFVEQGEDGAQEESMLESDCGKEG